MSAPKRPRFDTTCALKRFQAPLERANTRRLKLSEYTSPTMVADQIMSSNNDDALTAGHEIMDRIRDYMAQIDETWGSRPGERFERSRDQRLMHEKIIGAVSKFVYGSAYAPNELKILKYNRLKSVHTAIAFTAPRRFGKSMTIAIICAALFMAVPNMEIVIVAQGARAAGKKAGILGLIKVILSTCFRMNKFETDDKEHVIDFFPDRRAIHAYSAKSGDGYVFSVSDASKRARPPRGILILKATDELPRGAVQPKLDGNVVVHPVGSAPSHPRDLLQHQQLAK